MAVPRGAFLGPELLDVGGDRIARPLVRRGERAADIVAEGSPELVGPGARVDVIVTRDRGDSAAGATELALEDVEVLACTPAPDTGGARDLPSPRVQATLRVTVAQAVYLAGVQAFARDVRLLPRAAGDRVHHGRLRVDEGALR